MTGSDVVGLTRSTGDIRRSGGREGDDVAASRGRPHPGPGSRSGLGVVSGFALKLVRRSTGLTQAALAEELARDLATVQGWESGRRPLTALRTVDLMTLRAKLMSHGASPDLVGLLRDCMDADLVITAAVGAGEEDVTAVPAEHPLALAVHRRDLTNLITWPLTGETPARLASLRPQIARRGPVADGPALRAEERTRFFDHLRVVADRYRGGAEAVLRRQAIYLLGFDERLATRRWLHEEQRQALRAAGRQDDVPSWVSVRSSAVALAQEGDRESLHDFVARGLVHDVQESANLNYWAYWLGEISDTYADDRFMTVPAGRRWTGERVLEHLLTRLEPDSAHLALNVHTVWALMLARPRLVDGRAQLRALAGKRVEHLMDSPDLPTGTRQELAGIAYGIRLADR